MYYETGQEPQWNGYIKDQPVAQDVYIFIIEYVDKLKQHIASGM